MNITGYLKNENLLSLDAYSPVSLNNGLNLTGDLFQSVDPEIQSVEKPPDESTGTTEPDNQDFNPKALSKLTTKQEYPLVVTVPKTKVKVVNGDDLSDYLVSLSLSFPISGAIEGDISLTGIPKDIKVNVGRFIEIKQCWYKLDGTENCLSLGKFYVITSPKTYSDTDGTINMDIVIGDELNYFGERNRTLIELYCGSRPTQVGKAAEIYAKSHGLKTRSFPSGHKLPNLDDQSFSSESPYQYLQSLYAPENKDVRCDANGNIIIKKRPDYGENTIHKISWYQVLELDPRVAYNYEEIYHIKINNNFTLLKSMDEEQISYTSTTSIPSNKKPWFKGGYTETETTKWMVGETLVHEEIHQKGYVPTVNQWSDNDQKADQCEDGTFDTKTSNPIPVEWGTVKKETYSLTSRNHISGARLVVKEERWINGKKVEKGTGISSGKYKLYDGKLKYQKDEYENTPQINPEVCEKDYIYLQTKHHHERYGFTESVFGYRLQEQKVNKFEPITKSTLGLVSYIGSGQTWEKTEKRGSYSEDDDTFIKQPDRVIEDEDPPNSKWVRPPKQHINAFTEVKDDRVEVFEGKPQSKEAPFCFNMTQLETFGNRFLKENNGLSKSIEIVLPYHYVISLGDSVQFTDKYNEVKYYTVHNISINQELSDSVKTLLLRRVDY